MQGFVSLPAGEAVVGATNKSAEAPVGQGAVDPLTSVRADRFPAASKASTANVYVVAQAKPEIVKSVEAVEPTLTPFSYTPYPTTATLSEDVDHSSATPVAPAPMIPTPNGEVGGSTSSGELLVCLSGTTGGPEGLDGVSL